MRYYISYWDGHRYRTVTTRTEVEHLSTFTDLYDAGFIDYRTHSWVEEA